MLRSTETGTQAWSNVITASVLLVTVLITLLSAWWIRNKMQAARLAVDRHEEY